MVTGRDIGLTQKIEYFFLQRRLCKDKPQIIILSGPSLFFSHGLKRDYPQIKVIDWLHNTYGAYTSKYYANRISSFKNAVRAADLVVALTDTDCERYREIGGNVTRIYNPIVTRNTGSISKLTAKYICFVGRIVVEQKGLDRLVQLAVRIPNDWIIRIVGSGSAEEISKLKLLIEQNHVSDKINVLGELRGESLERVYATSSLFVLTSRWEGFGLVLLEAMSAGLPVISYDTSGPSEILAGGQFGKIVSNDLEFFNTVNDLIRRKDIRLKYQRLSLVRVQQFQVQQIASQWIHEIKAIVGKVE